MRNAAFAVPLLATYLAAQPYPSGPQVLTFSSNVDDTDQPYGLYLPHNFDASRKYPLVISLHADGSNHRLDLRWVFGIQNRIREVFSLTPGGPRQRGISGREVLVQETDSEAANGPFPSFANVDFIVATPLARGSMGYQGIAEKDVYDVLTDVKRRFPIDENRVYLTGSSMGGGGALWLALTRPDIWAAVAPICPLPPPGTEELAPNALGMSVRMFAGALDPMVPVDTTRVWYKRLRDAGAGVEYTEYPVVKHNAWSEAYKNAGLFNWFARFRRQQFPERVRFTTRSYKYNSAYWVTLEALTPEDLASIDARFTGMNQVEILTVGVDGFSLHPGGHPLYDSSKPFSLKVDGSSLTIPSWALLAFSKSGQGWKTTAYVLPTGAKRPGLEGPIREAVSGRHVYVYGTGGAPDEAELQRRRSQAEYAANWSDPRAPMLLSLPTVSDTEAAEGKWSSANLVLFGTKETNSLIAVLANTLPLQLNAGAADYGLVFIAPAGNRYVLVNSGLPFWTGAEKAKRPVFRFTPPLDQTLMGFGDFILFRGSLEKVVAEGFFDKNWKAPADVAAKMAATGAVEIR